VFDLYRANATHSPRMPLAWAYWGVVVDGTMGGCELGWLSARGYGEYFQTAAEIVQLRKK